MAGTDDYFHIGMVGKEFVELRNSSQEKQEDQGKENENENEKVKDETVERAKEEKPSSSSSLPSLGLTIPRPLTLVSLPSELLLQIFSYLDIPDLHCLTQTTHRLRMLSLDPLLHRHRLHDAKYRLAYLLARRPSLYSLKRERRIYLSWNEFKGRTLTRNLIRSRLKTKLGNRPDPGWLVERGVLPGGYLKREKKIITNITIVDSADSAAAVVASAKGAISSSSTTRASPLQPDYFCSRVLNSSNTAAESRGRGRGRRTINNNNTSYAPSLPPSSSSPLVNYDNNGGKRKRCNSNTYTYTQSISPVLLSRVRYLEKSLIRCYLQLRVRNRPSLEEAKTAGLIKEEMLRPSWAEGKEEEAIPRRVRPSVRYLVGRFANRSEGKERSRESRWGRDAKRRVVETGWSRRWDRQEKEREAGRNEGEKQDRHPPRARVLGLRKFWEGIGRSGGSGNGGAMNGNIKRESYKVKVGTI